MILGDSYITFIRKISILEDIYVSLESKFRGLLKQKKAKSRLFEHVTLNWMLSDSQNWGNRLDLIYDMARNTLSRNIGYTQTFLILFEQE